MLAEEELKRLVASAPEGADSIDAENLTATRTEIPSHPKFEELVLQRDGDPNARKVRYADDGTDLHPLDGSLESLEALNRKAKLRLKRPSDVGPYLRFYFGHLGDGSLRVVETADEVPWNRAAPKDEVARARDAVGPVRAKEDREGFRALATAVFREALVRLKIIVETAGGVRVEDKEVLVDGVVGPAAD